eukprot:TRINITY_DN13357_c0_g1_i2.p1 TRINITY_DN13357_c0_g1~~TRINITY_DN13357_c0_g1_i2.p1  ORF type:complete len:143 (+),score=40.82 TRINITY_DN13357_c0_g1_i2:170-598(+)
MSAYFPTKLISYLRGTNTTSSATKPEPEADPEPDLDGDLRSAASKWRTRDATVTAADLSPDGSDDRSSKAAGTFVEQVQGIVSEPELQQLLEQQAHTIAEIKNAKETLHALEQRSEQRFMACLLYTSPSPRDRTRSRMPSSA